MIEKLAEAVGAVLPESLGEDIRRNVKAAITSVLDDMDLITREELELQQAVLRKTREKVEVLEKELLALEQSMKR